MEVSGLDNAIRRNRTTTRISIELYQKSKIPLMLVTTRIIMAEECVEVFDIKLALT